MGKFKKSKIKKIKQTPITPTPKKPKSQHVCPVCGGVDIEYTKSLSDYGATALITDNKFTIYGQCFTCDSIWDLVFDFKDGLIDNIELLDGGAMDVGRIDDVYTSKSEFAFIPDSTPLYYETRVVDDTNTKGDKTDE